MRRSTSRRDSRWWRRARRSTPPTCGETCRRAESGCARRPRGGSARKVICSWPWCPSSPEASCVAAWVSGDPAILEAIPTGATPPSVTSPPVPAQAGGRSSPDISAAGIEVSSRKHTGMSSPGGSTMICTTRRERDHDPARWGDSQTGVRSSPGLPPRRSARRPSRTDATPPSSIASMDSSPPSAVCTRPSRSTSGTLLRRPPRHSLRQGRLQGQASAPPSGAVPARSLVASQRRIGAQPRGVAVVPAALPLRRGSSRPAKAPEFPAIRSRRAPIPTDLLKPNGHHLHI